MMIKRGLTIAFIGLLTLVVSAPWAISQPDEGVPRYNAAPPTKGSVLPPILGKEQLWGTNAHYAFQTHAYELAAKIPAVLYQQPCYCYCDRGMGHKSLHSCFEGTHGAECSVCLKELYYSYSMHKRGKTAAQIRQGIIKGDWKQLNLQTAADIN
ncbi:MAG: CYCXC family (seleno)protein [Terriglobales bacterium]